MYLYGKLRNMNVNIFEALYEDIFDLNWKTRMGDTSYLQKVNYLKRIIDLIFWDKKAFWSEKLNYKK